MKTFTYSCPSMTSEDNIHCHQHLKLCRYKSLVQYFQASLGCIGSGPDGGAGPRITDGKRSPYNFLDH